MSRNISFGLAVIILCFFVGATLWVSAIYFLPKLVGQKIGNLVTYEGIELSPSGRLLMSGIQLEHRGKYPRIIAEHIVARPAWVNGIGFRVDAHNVSIGTIDAKVLKLSGRADVFYNEMSDLYMVGERISWSGRDGELEFIGELADLRVNIEKLSEDNISPVSLQVRGLAMSVTQGGFWLGGTKSALLELRTDAASLGGEVVSLPLDLSFDAGAHTNVMATAKGAVELYPSDPAQVALSASWGARAGQKAIAGSLSCSGVYCSQLSSATDDESDVLSFSRELVDNGLIGPLLIPSLQNMAGDK